ncbi:MAG TPA: hypothetical protein VM287_01575, partial [Egibacteraceae bacterium]|nr:hypothetical protein [Egibacteraceae bacterium]
MRFTITPLGSDGTRTVAAVVDDIVRYLDSPDPLQAAAAGRPATLPAPANPARYYGDGSSEPGRWLGNGAAEMELAGPVATAD